MASLPHNQTSPLQIDQHAVDGRRGDAEVALQISLGGGAARHFRVRVDEGQILALFSGEHRLSGLRPGGSTTAQPRDLRLRWSVDVKLYRVELSAEERNFLQGLVRGGIRSARRVKRAQILLAADQGKCDEEIAQTVQVGTATIYRTRRRLVEEGLDAALSELPRSGAERKLSPKHEALLVATACSDPPRGRCRWTLRLLAGKVVELTDLEGVSHETIRKRLAEQKIKPWQHKMWCIPAVDSEFVARMEDVLDLYSEPLDPKKPVVCFDETPTQLISETRVPIAAEAGMPRRVDHEYKRNGTANLFVTVEPLAGMRHVEVTDQRRAVDFASHMKALVDDHYPAAETIRVVLDNLNTHRPASLYEAFPPDEARRILRRLELHYTPKHASWLNMAEIEIGVLRKQVLGRRIESREKLQQEVQAWQTERNTCRATINWTFSVDRARQKMGHLYPSKPP